MFLKKTITKAINLFLITVLLINIMPVQVLAVTIDSFNIEQDIKKPIIQPPANGNEEELIPLAIGEIYDKRTLNEKHILMDNGSIRAYVYDTDVHYNKNGKFFDIDNTLFKKNDYYINTDNPFKVKFSAESSNDLVSVAYGNNNISLSLKNSQKVTPVLLSDKKNQQEKISQIIDNYDFNNQIDSSFDNNNLFLEKSREEKNQEFINNNIELNKLSSGINYESIIGNADLEYNIISNKLKESIILNKSSDIDKDFVFYLETSGLEAIQNKDKTISIIDNNNKEIFFIEAPYMFDAALEQSNDVNYILAKEKTGYQIKINYDKKWLNSPDRVFPITIDPTITLPTNESNIYDTHIYLKDDVRPANVPVLGVGNNNLTTYGGPIRSLFKFDLPKLTSGDMIVGSQLLIHNYATS